MWRSFYKIQAEQLRSDERRKGIVVMDGIHENHDSQKLVKEKAFQTTLRALIAMEFVRWSM